MWESSSKAAESALQPFDDPPQVPPGEEAWKRLGVKIKSYLTGRGGLYIETYWYRTYSYKLFESCFFGETHGIFMCFHVFSF